MALRREIGLLGLTFVAVGGVLGSAWLFAPLLAAQYAGPASLIAWVIGGVAMLLLALTFAEISTMFPVAGGIARIPQFSHGRSLAMFLGWSAWVGYVCTAPLEVEAMLRYTAPYLPGLHAGTEPSDGLTLLGIITAAVVLLVLTVVNALGVAWFTRLNTTLTFAKIVFPLLFVVAVFDVRFEASNFTDVGGFVPTGISGVFAAVASGGIVYAFIGFRHAIDLAGEVRNPQTNIPIALCLSVVICLAVYSVVQIAFIGALDENQLAGGWHAIEARSELGPLGALATALGMLWLVSVLNTAAVISPMGSALVSVGSNGRLALAMANNGVFPRMIAALNKRGAPISALALNYVVGVTVMFTIPFAEVVTLHSAAIVMSLVAGPVALVALRKLAPDFKRSFVVPAGPLVAAAAFVIATLLIYWSGWVIVWRLSALLCVGALVFAARLAFGGRERIDLRGALWVLPYIVGLCGLSLLGPHSGGLGWVGDPYASLITAVFSSGIFILAMRAHLSRDVFDAYVAEEEAIEIAEYDGPDPVEEKIRPHPHSKP